MPGATEKSRAIRAYDDYTRAKSHKTGVYGKIIPTLVGATV